MNFFITYLIPLIVINAVVFCLIFFFKRKYLVPFCIYLAFLVVYILSNLSQITSQSTFNYFAYQADALLQGRTYLDFILKNHDDVAHYGGFVYIAQPPLPAFLMLPFTLLYGKAFNDILFTMIFGAANCALVYTMILGLNNRVPGNHFKPPFALFITLIFGLCSVHWYITVRGTVWHTSHIVALFFILLAINETLGKSRYLLIGLFAGLAILARPTVFFIFPFFVTLLVCDYLLKKKYRDFIIKSLLYIAPYVVLGILYMIWNYIRFEEPLEFGFNLMKHAPVLRNRYRQWGLLNLAYLPQNLHIAFTMFFAQKGFFPYLIPRPEGMGMLYTSPYWLLFFAPLVRLLARRFGKNPAALPAAGEAPSLQSTRTLIIGSLLAVFATAGILLLYFNSGWIQFGYRYVLDYIPFLLILLAFALRGKITKAAIVLAAIALVVNFYGMLIFIHFGNLVFAM